MKKLRLAASNGGAELGIFRILGTLCAMDEHHTGFSLRTENLSIGYAEQHSAALLFETLNLSLPYGKLTCFMGPNGIGKSTLIRTLSGLQKPLAGRFSKLDETKIALVLTDKISSANMRVYDLVSFGRYPYLDWDISLSKDDHAVIREAIAEVGIENLADRKVDELSDGQTQLAMIARALAQETDVLLLDEPTAHLDLNNRVEIMKLLHALTRKKNKAVLVATHELDLALQLADLIWLASADKTIKTGIPEDLVLDGSFDNTFQFKGFDLKTGRIQHNPYQDKSIGLQGSDYAFLWTKNALEREGFSVSTAGDILVTIEVKKQGLLWTHQNKSYTSIRDLLNKLKAI